MIEVHFSVPNEMGVKSKPCSLTDGATRENLLSILSADLGGGRYAIACGKPWLSRSEAEAGLTRPVSGEAFCVTCRSCQETSAWKKAMYEWVHSIEEPAHLPVNMKRAYVYWLTHFSNFVPEPNPEDEIQAS